MLDPPYPADTKANGWKPEMDVCRIDTSETWVLATEKERPWLLRIWFESWRSVPVGSMPGELILFSRRIGCKIEYLETHEKILLRNWKKHLDGRFYHPYITDQVMQMLEKRSVWAKKQKARRDKVRELKGNVSGDSRGSLRQEQEQEQEQDIKSKDTARGNVSQKPNFKNWPQSPSPEQWSEILKFRKAKKAKNTQRAIDLLGKQIKIAISNGHSFQECLDTWEQRQWCGFDASWMDNQKNNGTWQNNGNGNVTLPNVRDVDAVAKAAAVLDVRCAPGEGSDVVYRRIVEEIARKEEAAMRKTDIKPGEGWEYIAGAVWRHKSGARIHVMGIVRLSNRDRHNLNHLSDGAMGRLMVQANGANRKRGLMAWARMLENAND